MRFAFADACIKRSERENKSARNAARMSCKSATNRSPLDGSNANGKQRRKGTRDQEAIGRAIAGELQRMETL